MALRPYLNETSEWLEAAYKEISRQLVTGKTIISVSAGDTSSTSMVVANPYAALSQIIFELHVRDPLHWTADMLLENRTRVNFA